MTRTKSTHLALIAVLLSPFAANADPIVVLFPDVDDFRIASVLGVNVGGTFYDVTFDTNIQWDAFKAANPLSYLPFSTSEVASTANDVLRDAINAALIDASSGGGGDNRLFNIFTAYAETATTFLIDSIFNGGGLNPYTFISGFNGPLSTSYNMNAARTPQAFTTWAATAATAVPEPGTLALLGIGLFGMGLARRRQKV